jgi:hypothetical protein
MPVKGGKTKRKYFGKHSKGKKTVKRGGFYGASGAIAPGAMQWNRGSEMGEYSLSNRGGNGMQQYGRGRKGTKGHKRRHRGGGSFGATYGSYQGKGENGLTDLAQGTHAPGQAALGDFNNKGAGPGNFSSFMSSRAF